MINPDMSQYLGLFLDEGEEQLALLETHCIDLERTEDPDAVLQILFRAAHTLKGSSRAMGFSNIGELTHEMENVLDDLRNHQMALSPTVVDLLLTCLDALSSMVDGVRESGVEPDVEALGVPLLVERLMLLRQEESTPAPADEEIVPRPAAEIAVGFRVLVELSPACLMKGIRGLLIYNAVGEWVPITGVNPALQDIENDRFDTSFELEIEKALVTPDLLERISRLAEVASVRTVEAGELEATEAPQAIDENPPTSAKVGVAEDKPLEAVRQAESPKKDVLTKSPAPTGAPQQVSQTVRVDVGRLDKLLNLVGELVTDRTQLSTLVATIESRYSNDDEIGLLSEALGRVGRITSELQDDVMKTRLLPIDVVFQRMPRMVRDLAQKIGKQISFVMEGGETEIDRSVVDTLGDPLIHLLRNAVDHGIELPQDRESAGKNEEGTVCLAARRVRSEIVVEITDDGNGIDPAKIRQSAVNKGIITEAAASAMTDRESINLIFAPGFSTAAAVTDVSGRGVGMDIVRSNIEKMGGRVLIDSKIGQGSTFTIYLPLTLAIVRAVLVGANGITYALPVSSVTEMIDLSASNEEISHCTVGGRAALLLRGQTMPLVSLADALQGSRKALDIHVAASRGHAVVVHHEDTQTALSVDAVHGEQEVVIKPLGSYLGDIPGIAGASILGDGHVALIVDAARALQFLNGGIAA